MEELKQGKFEGWAKVEIMGHQSHIGFVTTEAFGAVVLFRCDMPPADERDWTLTKPEYLGLQINGDRNLTRRQYWPAGTKVRRQARPPLSVLLGPGSIYRIMPCTEEAALLAIEQEQPRRLILLECPEQPAIEAAPCPECGLTGRHDATCIKGVEEEDENDEGPEDNDQEEYPL